jgi:hypothetical protein
MNMDNPLLWSLCQSCARPMLQEKDHGTNSDGTKNEEYCLLCFREGKFIQSEMTREEMIEQVTDQITKRTAMPRVQAEEITQAPIPTLKRWQKLS